jgi:hypothetical protein
MQPNNRYVYCECHTCNIIRWLRGKLFHMLHHEERKPA